MKVCGIELKANEARIVALDGRIEDFEMLQLDFTKLKLEDPKSQDAVKDFYVTITNLFAIQKFDKIAIKERIMKGRFKGGPLSFKMETLIQMVDEPVEIVHSARVKSKIKDVDVSFDDLKKFQEEAFRVALYLLVEE